MPGGNYFARKIKERMEESNRVFNAKPIEEKIAHYEKTLRMFLDSHNLEGLCLCIGLTENIIELRTEKIKRDYCE